METLSQTYGWTPDQIRTMRKQDVEDYLDIISIRHQIEKAQIKKNRK